MVLFNGLFVVTQINQATVLRFGELHQVYTGPGLNFRIPFIEEVTFLRKQRF